MSTSAVTETIASESLGAEGTTDTPTGVHSYLLLYYVFMCVKKDAVLYYTGCSNWWQY